MSSPSEDSPDEMLTTAQLAAEWNVSTKTITRYISQGRLPATRLPGGYLRIKRTDVAAALSKAASA